MDVLAGYYVANNDIYKGLDVGGLMRIEVPPLRTLNQALLTINKELGRVTAPVTHDGATFLLPTTGEYPRWFVSIATGLRGGVPSVRPVYTLFTQRARGAPWLAAYQVSPVESVPTVHTNDGGAARVVKETAGLAIDPAGLGGAVLAHYVEHSHDDGFAPSIALDEQLAANYRVNKQNMTGRGWKLSRELEDVTHPVHLLATTDGGVLAFTASTVTDTIEPLDRSGSVSLDTNSNEASLLRMSAGMTSKKLEIERLQMFLTHIPSKSSGQKVRVLSFNDAPINIR
ncbi:hypothetical protein FKR81_40470 [Lentzea tibetensis]|uniref:DUF8094 domain-containing protein n=1 Tax=Lentzea tibetensis TaxID=2591470 RepID=A0A563EFV1_9PSEU|nr:hypothetical protein [Lentzea tibetensis]TWP44960.1 hypothetical protein FKR81_40470 [Lentzea tibetensis]